MCAFNILVMDSFFWWKGIFNDFSYNISFMILKLCEIAHFADSGFQYRGPTKVTRNMPTKQRCNHWPAHDPNFSQFHWVFR